MYDYSDYGYYSGMGTFPVIVTLVIAVVALICLWRIFSKAGKPGWASLIPIYNFYVFFDITWGKGAYFLLMIIPFVNIVISIMTIGKLAKVFGKGAGFALGLFFLSPIFMLILAFGNATYIGIQGAYSPNYNAQQNYSPYQSRPQQQPIPQYQPRPQQQPMTQYQAMPLQNANAEFCINCGARLGEGEFCSGCGAKRQRVESIPDERWQCSCGRMNTGDFCPICGTRRQ